MASVLTARGFFPVWAAVLLALLSLAAVVLVYAREAGRVAAWRRAVLATLRGVALLSIIGLLLKPTLVRDVSAERPRPVALLIDDTQSMTTKDRRPPGSERWRAALAFDKVAPTENLANLPVSSDWPEGVPENATRLDIAKAAFRNPRLQLLARLRKVGPVQPASFGGRRLGHDPRDDSWIEALGGKEPRTALADSVLDVLKRDENELPAAVVIATDGRENASSRTLAEAARECARLKVPLHIYGVGGSSSGQITLRDVAVAETLFVDDTVAVPVRYRVRGYRDAQAEITVKLGGREVARKMVTLTEGDDLRETLSFVPTKGDAQPGKQDLTIAVRVVTEADQAGDETVKSVRVVNRKLKVLVAESIPRWDFKYLQRALLRDRRVEARFWLAQADKEALNAGPPFLPAFPSGREELFEYDLVVLGDIAASAFTTAQLEAIRDFVAEGGGLIQIAGRLAGPATYNATPLADILPVEFSPVSFPIDSGTRTEAFKPLLTAAGLRSSALKLDDDAAESARLWRELPGVHFFYPVTKLKPAAEALLVHPTAKLADGKPTPLLAAHYYGKGYVLFAAFDETWRWRYNAADRYFGRYWSQLVYLAGVPRTVGTKLTQLSLDTLDPLLGKAGQVYARLLKPDLTPQTTDQVEATLERLDAPGDQPAEARSQRLTLRRLPGVGGEYTATVPFNRVGRFTMTVDNGGSPGVVEYRVGLPPDHELSSGGLAEEELRSLAVESGGGFYREEDLHKLPDAVARRTVTLTHREETVLWNEWALLWVVGLMACEWFFRKLSSLS